MIRALIISCLCLLSACSNTVTPAAVESHQASFDQGNQNSGLVAMLPGNAGAIITPHAHDRYVGLVAIYGHDFLPPLVAEAEVYPRADGNYDVTAAVLQNFILMNNWHRMGREPRNK